jgi:predicted PurR-regulated permease PerM
MERHEVNKDEKPATSEQVYRSRVRLTVRMAATVAGLYICYRLGQPFIPAFTWALTLAVLFYPVHQRIERRCKHSGAAALISVLLVSAIVTVPAIFLAGRVIVEANKGALIIKENVENGKWQNAIRSDPNFGPLGRWMEDQLDIPGMIGNAATWLTNLGASFVRLSVVEMVTFLLTFYLLFYFLRDYNLASRLLRRLLPLSNREMNRLFVRVVDTIQATIYGTVVIAGVQGALGGVMFWWLDLPEPLLWGVVMGMLAIIPVLGAFVIWIPFTIFLALQGNWFDALILASWGTVVVGGIDNLIYPILVGNRLKLHTIPSFIAIVGGIILFGSSGIILGPLALTITLFLLEIGRDPVSACPSCG